MITVDNEGRFVPKIVQVFHESAGVTAIRSGLQEGEKVVASGLFLIDSEANIAGALDACARRPLMPRPLPPTRTKERNHD